MKVLTKFQMDLQSFLNKDTDNISKRFQFTLFVMEKKCYTHKWIFIDWLRILQQLLAMQLWNF